MGTALSSLQGSGPASCDGGLSVARSNPDKDVTKDFTKDGEDLLLG